MQPEAEQIAEQSPPQEPLRPEQLAEHTAVLKVANAIVEAINAVAPEGLQAVVANTSPSRTDYGMVIYPRVEFDVPQGVYSYGFKVSILAESGAGWRRSKNGKLRVKVGDYGGTSQFPQKQDGSHSYDKTAEEVVSRYRAEVRRQQEAMARQSAEAQSAPVAEAIRAGLGSIGIGVAPRDGTKVTLSINLKREVDPALAAEIAKFLMERGIK